MSVALLCASHTPLMFQVEPGPGVREEVTEVFDNLRERVARFDPELVITFAPDHYNGFFYDLVPSFCLGIRAESVGDWGLPVGPLSVTEKTAWDCLGAMQDADLDPAFSLRMQVDHGTTQMLDLLFGGIDRVPVVPLVINCPAPPQPRFRRVRALGEAVGKFAGRLDQRVLLIASGGLSHDPPMPRLSDPTPQVQEFLLAGRNPSPEARQARQARVMAAAGEFAAGRGGLVPLDEAWDREFMDHMLSGNLQATDHYDQIDLAAVAGCGGHEVRTWVGAFAAYYAATGGGGAQFEYYRAIPEWIAGFGVATAALP